MLLKRRIFAAWLLSVVLPMVFFAPFHHHDLEQREDVFCEDCSQHLPHHGHLSAGTATGECLVCQFLFQPFTPSESSVIRSFLSDSETYVLPPCGEVILLSFQPVSPRAPPVSFRIQ
jgi:hypothetical protein